MKTYSLNELNERAKEHFDQLQVNKLFATSDGQFFLMENRAQLHAGKGTVHKIKNEEPSEGIKPTEEEKPTTVKELLVQIEQIEDVTTLNDMLMAEISGQNRSTAVKSIEAKIAHLTK